MRDAQGLQWGHRFTSVETRRFPVPPAAMQNASMGPPIYIGGNMSAFLPAYRVLIQLQWGHRFTSVETADVIVPVPLPKTLQWGHRFTSVETNTLLYRADIVQVASMGPPIYIGGNKSNPVYGDFHNSRLQWGHRFTSVETGWTWTPEACVWSASMGPPIYIGGNRR